MSEAPEWTIIITRRAEKTLRRLPSEILQRIDRKILSLAENPKPADCEKLTGYDNLYRVRVGDWRISYAVEQEEVIILILEVAPRGGAYRNL